MTSKYNKLLSTTKEGGCLLEGEHTGSNRLINAKHVHTFMVFVSFSTSLPLILLLPLILCIRMYTYVYTTHNHTHSYAQVDYRTKQRLKQTEYAKSQMKSTSIDALYLCQQELAEKRVDRFSIHILDHIPMSQSDLCFDSNSTKIDPRMTLAGCHIRKCTRTS